MRVSRGDGEVKKELAAPGCEGAEELLLAQIDFAAFAATMRSALPELFRLA